MSSELSFPKLTQFKSWTNIRLIFNFVFHPITIFVALQLITIAIAILWVVYFVDQSALIAEAHKTFGSNHFDSSFALGALIAGCILLGMLIVGTISLFIFAQKQSMINQQQKSFVSSVTHELRSPLASLQLTAETIQHRQLDKTTMDKMSDMMTRDIGRLSKLVDQILLSAQLDRGLWLSSSPETFSLHDIIQSCLDDAPHLDQNLRDRVVIKISGPLLVHQKKQAMMIVIGNLLENATKYSPAETPISIRAFHANDLITIEVSDCGIGLDPEDKKRIFRLFHRGKQALRRAIPGTGLGLFIVQNIVHALGGNIRVESPGLGQGCTFVVNIPGMVGTKT